MFVHDGMRRVINQASSTEEIEGENADTKTPKTLRTLGIKAAHVTLPSHLRRSHAR